MGKRSTTPDRQLSSVDGVETSRREPGTVGVGRPGRRVPVTAELPSLGSGRTRGVETVPTPTLAETDVGAGGNRRGAGDGEGRDYGAGVIVRGFGVRVETKIFWTHFESVGGNLRLLDSVPLSRHRGRRPLFVLSASARLPFWCVPEFGFGSAPQTSCRPPIHVTEYGY